jgi:hypothetical protein
MYMNNNGSTRTVWVDTRGQRHPIRTMADSHLVNVLDYLAERAVKAVPSLRTQFAVNSYLEEHVISYPLIRDTAIERGILEQSEHLWKFSCVDVQERLKRPPQELWGDVIGRMQTRVDNLEKGFLQLREELVRQTKKQTARKAAGDVRRRK